mgnify:CR=1 FL=1|jgi:hypothetical protein|tara:strand:+ start:302 stop:691 length:390 start_codon:yes stop_codon:yes gene_type:complete
MFETIKGPDGIFRKEVLGTDGKFHLKAQGDDGIWRDVGRLPRDYNVGHSDYSERRIQPWDIWREYSLNPWDADIVKRILREKGERRLDYEKIKHICDERIRQIDEELNHASNERQESAGTKASRLRPST